MAGRKVRTVFNGQRGTVLPGTRNASLQKGARKIGIPIKPDLAMANPERAKSVCLN